jgi:predicted ATPase
MRALSLLMMGHIDQSLAASADALNLSLQVGHQPSIAHTHLFRAELFIILNRPKEANAHLQTCIAISKKYSLAAYLNSADLKEGWVRVMLGDSEQGLRQTDAALRLLMSVPTRRFHLPIRIAIAGRTKAASGDVNGALALFDTALEAATTTGERWYEPELHRLRAEMLLASGEQYFSAAEQCLKTAIAIAGGQKAKFWSLRATTALAKLWLQNDRGDEGRDLLAPVYSQFTEGLDTPDLIEAKVLLDSSVR